MQLQTTVSFETKNIRSELCNKLFNASHVSHLFKKHNSIETNISRLFRLNYTNILIKTTQQFPCLYRSKVVYDFIAVQQAFAVSSLSILIKAISRNLPWLIVNQWGPEVWKDQFQFTERSFAACNKHCITAIISIIYKAIRRMSGGLQDAITLSYITWNQHFAI